MAGVQLGLSLDLTAFNEQITLAHSKLEDLKGKAQGGVGLKLFLDTSDLRNQIEAAKKTIEAGSPTVNVASKFYKVGSGKTITATALKRDVIDVVQRTVDGRDEYKIKIGTTFKFDPASLKSIKDGIAQAEQAFAGTTKNIDAARSKLIQLTRTQGQGGLAGKEFNNLRSAASQAGIKATGSGLTELRKSLASEFQKAGADVIEGLARGLIEGKVKVADSSSELGQEIIKALKKALDIKSPSGEGEKIGENITDGITKGLVGKAVDLERQMAQSIRKAIAGAWRDGLARDAAGRSALANFGKSAGTTISTSITRALKDGLSASVGPAIRGGLLGATGGMATGGLVGGGGAAVNAIKQAVGPSMLQFGYGSIPQKLSMLGQGAASLASGGANDAFSNFLQQSVDSVVSAALSTGGQGALLGAAGVAGVAGMTGLARGAGGSLVTQAVEAIKNRILGSAVQQAQAQAMVPGSTGGAVTAPIENAGNVFGALKSASGSVAKGLLDFARSLTPGKLQERIVNIAFSIDQAAEQFDVMRRDVQVISGRLRAAWQQMDGGTPQHMLPPQPVPGTSLVRRGDIQLGNVVGRTAFDFQRSRSLYGVEGGSIGPAEIDGGRGYIEQTRRTLKAIAGSPGEWRIVDEANGVWQRIKADSELAAERIAQIRAAITGSQQFTNIIGPRNTRGVGPDGGPLLQNNQSVVSTFTSYTGNIGTFNPFDQAFYRPTQPPQAPPPGGSGNFGGNRFGTPAPGGALALRSVPVEVFASFREAERLLATVENRLRAVAAAFDNLRVKSQVQVDQGIRRLQVSLQAVITSFQRGEIGLEDVRAAAYGFNREMAGLGSRTAQVQNLTQAFENLGIQSQAAYEAIQGQRNIDLEYILAELPAIDGDNDRRSDRNRARNMAVNARDLQVLTNANEVVQSAQSQSGFGGFRGRTIGNDELLKAQQRSALAIDIDKMYGQRASLGLTSESPETQRRVLAAYTREIENAERALRVLNGTAKDGETITHLARNAWGTILDDFKNLVPQLLVFAVAYNLIIQRVLTTPGAVIQAAASFDRLETSISGFLSATRGIGDATKNISELRQISLDLGIGFDKAASSYLSFAAATQGTSVEGREEEIVRTIATTGRNLGLSGEQIDRASVALTQMLSKGRVQSEELRQQLAEQMPGALQVAARAFNVTTAELYRMVEAGQIAGDEFVAKFINQLQAEGNDVNRLSGTFANVTEQLGATMQVFAAEAGKPMLAPLTVALQAVNSVMQGLLPVMPVVTGMFLLLGAAALKATVLKNGFVKEMIGVTRTMFAAADSAEGWSRSLVKLTGVAKAATIAAKALGKALLIGVAIQAVSGAISFAKGEVGSLGDELKKVRKTAEGGIGGGLSGIQKFLGRLNVAQNISDGVTVADSAKIVKESESLGKKMLANENQIRGAIAERLAYEKEIARVREEYNKAERDEDSDGMKRAKEEIKELERKRDAVKFAVSFEDVQTNIGALESAEQAVEEVQNRFIALGDTVSAEVAGRQVAAIRAAREELQKQAKDAGLLDERLRRLNTLAGLQSRIQAVQNQLPTLDVNSEGFQEALRLLGALRMGAEDQQLTPAERSLKTQEASLQRMTKEFKVQENILRIRLGIIENEKKALESNLNLERTRTQLAETIAQRRADVARAVNSPEDALDAELRVQGLRERGQERELRIRSQILNTERARIGIETELQKQQVRLQTEQLKISIVMLKIEVLRVREAMRIQALSADLRSEYSALAEQLNKQIHALEDMVRQESQLLRSTAQRSQAELASLDAQQQMLDVEQRIIRERGLTERQLNYIQQAQQQIANREQESLNAVRAANEENEAAVNRIEAQLGKLRSIVELQKERLRISEETKNAEIELIDRMLDLQRGRNEGGFFERIAKASTLAAAGEQEVYSVAAERMRLQRELQDQQIRQKQLELNLKREEIKAEEALNRLRLKGLQIANQERQISVRNQLERTRLALTELGGNATPGERATLAVIDQALAELGGLNAGRGSSRSLEVETGGLLASAKALKEQQDEIQQQLRDGETVANDRIRLLKEEGASQERLIEISQRLYELDSAAWFSQFIDSTTQLGRTLTETANGLSEFRSSVSKAFADVLTTGGNAFDAVAEAGGALANKVLTSIFDEYVFKPVETNLFAQLSKWLPGLAPKESSEDKTAANTEKIDESIGTLDETVKDGLKRVIEAINRIPSPTREVEYQVDGVSGGNWTGRGFRSGAVYAGPTGSGENTLISLGDDRNAVIPNSRLRTDNPRWFAEEYAKQLRTSGELDPSIELDFIKVIEDRIRSIMNQPPVNFLDDQSSSAAGGVFDVSRLERSYGEVASLGGASVAATRQVDELGEAAAGSAPAIAGLGQSAAALLENTDGASTALGEVKGAAESTPSMVQRLNSSLSIAANAVAGIGMIAGGVQAMSGGGTYNTLMGLSGIFGGIASVTGMFGTGGPLAGVFGGGGGSGSFVGNPVQVGGIGAIGPNFGIPQRAAGGPVRARKPYWVGERGIELFVPQTDGAIVPNHRLFAANRAAIQDGDGVIPMDAMEENAMALAGLRGGAGRSSSGSGSGGGLFGQNLAAMSGASRVAQQQHQEAALARAAAMPARLEFNYESSVINNVEYVTADQFQRGMADAAERGRAMAISSLQNSVNTRRRIGI